MRPSVLVRAVSAAVVCIVSVALGDGGQKPGQPTPPPVVAGRVDFFEQTQRWFEVVRTHQIGESDAAVATAAGLPSTTLARVVDDLRMIHALLDAAVKKRDTSVEMPGRKLRLGSLPRLMGLKPEELALPVAEIDLPHLGDPTAHARQVISRIMIQAAMLHTYVAVQLEERSHEEARSPAPSSATRSAQSLSQLWSGSAVQIRDGQRIRVPSLAVHWAIAREALDIVGPPSTASPTVRQWYVFVAEYLQQQLNYSALIPHLEKARELFPSDGRVFLFSGAACENLAGPRVQSAADDGSGPLPGASSPDNLLKEAERYLRRALELEPQMAIAQLRLGRVLDLTGRHDEAATLLRQAESGATDSVSGYLASLYLGHAEETRGRDGEARAAYERASTLFPQAQSPTLALAALAWRTKSRDEAAAGLRTLPARRSTYVMNDPWWHSDVSHVGDVPPLLKQLRLTALEAVR